MKELSKSIVRRMSELGRLGTGLLLPALEQYHSVSEPAGPPVHDVCAVAWVAVVGGHAWPPSDRPAGDCGRSAMMVAMEEVVRTFVMPGTGILDTGREPGVVVGAVA